MESCQREYRNAFLMRTPGCQVSQLFNTVIASLQAAALRGGAQRELLSQAVRANAALMKTPSPLAPGLAQLGTAVLHALDGRTEQALQHSRLARGALTSSSFQHACGFLEGLHEGGDAGRAKRAALRSWLEGHGFRNVDQALLTVIPGLDLLHARY